MELLVPALECLPVDLWLSGLKTHSLVKATIVILLSHAAKHNLGDKVQALTDWEFE